MTSWQALTQWRPETPPSVKLAVTVVLVLTALGTLLLFTVAELPRHAIRVLAGTSMFGLAGVIGGFIILRDWVHTRWLHRAVGPALLLSGLWVLAATVRWGLSIGERLQ